MTLDGTATDPEDDALSHAWSSNGGGTFADDSAPDTTWTAPEPTQADQVVTLTLTVTDAKGASATAEVVVTVLENLPPAVSATAAPRTVLGGGTVTLDGTATDPEDDALSHAWSSNGGGTFADDSAPDTTWTAPEPTQADQVVTLTLTVTDAKGASATAEVVVTVLENQPPAVSATAAPRTVLGGGTVTLDGTATDLEDDALSHAWSSNGGGTFADDSAPDTTWTAPEPTQADQVVTLTLTVTDAKGASATAEVVVTVLENQPPAVSATAAPRTVLGGGTVTLDGTATDLEDDALSHAWSSNGGGTFADDSAPDTTWTAPEPTQADQVVTLTLTVTDAKGASATAEVVVTVLENQPPAVSATAAPRTVLGGGTVTLDGTATDLEDDALSHAWSSNGGGTFADDSAPDTTWTAPEATQADQVVTLTLTVTDAKGASATAEVVVTVLENQPPAVSATAAPRTVLGGGTVTLDGTATDLEDDALSHAWSSNGGGTFADDSAPDTTWTAPEATQADQVVTLTLTVTDAKGASATAEVVVTVLENQPPAGVGGQRCPAGSWTSRWRALGTIMLDGRATDPEDDTLSHAWSSNGGGTFADDSAPDTTWTAPEPTQADQVVTLTLTVTDAKGASATAEVVVTVLENQPPRVWVDNVSGGFVDFEVEGLGTIMLDGRATDPEDDALSYAWSSNGGGTFADDSAPDTTWDGTQADRDGLRRVPDPDGDRRERRRHVVHGGSHCAVCAPARCGHEPAGHRGQELRPADLDAALEPARRRDRRERGGSAAAQRHRLDDGRHAGGLCDLPHRCRAGGGDRVLLPYPPDGHQRRLQRLRPAARADAGGRAAGPFRGVLADADQRHAELVDPGDRGRVQAGTPQGRRRRVDQDQGRLRPSPQRDGPSPGDRGGGRSGVRHPVPLPGERPRRRHAVPPPASSALPPSPRRGRGNAPRRSSRRSKKKSGKRRRSPTCWSRSSRTAPP